MILGNFISIKQILCIFVQLKLVPKLSAAWVASCMQVALRSCWYIYSLLICDRSYSYAVPLSLLTFQICVRYIN